VVLVYAILNFIMPAGCSSDLIWAAITFNYQEVASAKLKFLKLTFEKLNLMHFI